jgi:selenide,water dikinase
LEEVLKQVSFPSRPEVMVGSEHADDAGVYRINDQLALIHTVDIFTPIVDDPYLYGQIAAANAMSDVYAMGGRPVNALNIIGFPDSKLDQECFAQILQGGSDKVAEAGAAIIGGHSVKDTELKYGLAVTGLIHPEKVRKNHSLRAGDVLLLTKPVGTGVLTTALKNDAVSEAEISDAIESMLRLNEIPGLKMADFSVSACTDVTGFGLGGHLWEMINGNNMQAELTIGRIPFFPRAIDFARDSKYIPGGTIANYRYVEPYLEMTEIEPWYLNLLFDPQTSGGLLISIAEEEAEDFIESLTGYPFPVSVIGRILPGEDRIVVR